MSDLPKTPQTKTQEVYAQVLALALELEPNAKLPTVEQMCRDFQVSITTLVSALTKLENDNIISRKQGSGIFVSPHLHQKSVGLVCDPAFFRAGTSPFWQQLIEGVRERAASKNEAFRFYLALPSSREALPLPDDLLEDVRAHRLHGVLFVGNNKPAVRWMLDCQVPVVAFAGWSEWTVQMDYGALLDMAVERLAAQGCRTIGLLTWDESTIGEATKSGRPLVHNLPLMITAFRQALEKRGLPFAPESVGQSTAAEPAQVEKTHREQGYEAAMKLFGQRPQSAVPLQGLVIVDDLMAQGALAALRQLGLSVGRDIKVVSHANRGSSVLHDSVLHDHEAELSLIEFDPAAVVQAMFSTLDILMDGHKPAVPDVWVLPRAAS